MFLLKFPTSSPIGKAIQDLRTSQGSDALRSTEKTVEHPYPGYLKRIDLKGQVHLVLKGTCVDFC